MIRVYDKIPNSSWIKIEKQIPPASFLAVRNLDHILTVY